MPFPRNLKMRTIKEVMSNNELRRSFMHNVHPRIHLSLIGGMDRPVADKLVWGRDSTGIVSTNSFMKVFVPIRPTIRKFEIIWQSWLPLKVSCFLWKVLHHALPTHDNVTRVGISLASKCVCCVTPCCDSMEHLFIHGDMACMLWNFLCPLFRKLKPGSLNDFFYDWGVNVNLQRSSDILGFGLACLCLWEIWKIHNDIVYSNGARSFSHYIIFRCANSLAKCIPRKCINDFRSWSICTSLRILPPGINAFRVLWIPWKPSPYGNTCNVAINIAADCSRISAIIRDRNGVFVYAYKAVVVCKHFIKCLFQVFHELEFRGIRYVRLQSSHADVSLLGRDASLPWSLFQIKRKLVKNFDTSEIFRVSFSMNKPAEVLCFSSFTNFRTARFGDLPDEVCSALIQDGVSHPCSFADQRIYI